MHHNQSPHGKGLLIVTAGVFVLSFDALLVRLADTTPWNLVFWRGLLMFLSLGLVTLIQGATKHSQHSTYRFQGLWSIGLVAGVGLVLFPLALAYTSTANTVVILTSSPLFAAILARLFLHEKLSRSTWIAIFTVCIGIAVIFSGSLTGSGLLGDFIALAAALNFGLNMTMLRGRPAVSRIAVTAVSGLVAAAICLPMADPFSLTGYQYLLMCITGLVQMPVAMLLIYTGTRYLPAAEVSLLILIESILAPIWVWLAVDELPARETYIGGALILTTLVIHSWLLLRRTCKPVVT